jgi:hypothetical protein
VRWLRCVGHCRSTRARVMVPPEGLGWTILEGATADDPIRRKLPMLALRGTTAFRSAILLSLDHYDR